MEIKIKLNSNRIVDCESMIIGKTYENEATTLMYELKGEELLTKDFYIEFEKPDGTKISTSKLEIEIREDETIKTEGIVKYSIPNSLLNIKGTLKVEAVLRNSEGLVWKSYTQKFEILESINASEEIAEQYPDVIGEVQHVIDLIDTTGDGTKYLSDDGTYKEVSGGSVEIDIISDETIEEIVNGSYNPGTIDTTSILDQAILGTMILQ